MEITNNYNNYTTPYSAQKQTASASEATKGDSVTNNADYLNSLKKLAPSMAFEIGSSLNMKNDGKTNTLTINPKLLEKMQNDPEQAKETSELLRGIEQAEAFSKSFNAARGMETVFNHWYVDENGKCCKISLTVSKNKGKSFTKEFQKRNDEIAQKRAERREEQKKIAEKRDAKKTSSGKAEKLLEKKLNDSKDGIISLDHKDFQTLLTDIQEKRAKEAENAVGSGYNLDLRV